MDQIIKHFTPALTALCVGLLMIGIFAALLTSNGPVAQAFQNCITSALTSLQNAMP